MTLAVGLVGLGFGEQVLLPALRRVRGVRVVGVASAHPEKTRAAAHRLGIPLAAENWRDLVNDPNIHALVLAVPPAVQEGIARHAILQGKSVFCEKPLTTDRRSAEALARLAAGKRVVTAVDFEFPEIPVWRKALTLLSSGSIGTVREMQVTWNVETYAVKRDLRSWKTESASGGGVLNNFVSHSFHYIEHFLGPIARMNCRLVRARGLKRVTGETGAYLWLDTLGGVPVSATVTTHAPGEPEHKIVFMGSRGRLVLANRGKDYAAGFSLMRETEDGIVRLLGVTKSRRVAEDGRVEPTAGVMRKWIRAIKGRRVCRPGFIEGARVQRLVETARLSDSKKKWVKCA